MKKSPLILLLALSLLPQIASAATSPSLIPTATGTYSEWSPNTGTTHYTTVDETPCNGVTDYVATTTLAKRDSFVVSLASIPNNAIVSAIAIAPCASRATTGTGSSVLNVFYRWGAVNSSDLGAYAPSGTTPTTLATSTWSSLNFTKTATSTLEIGMVYTSGTKGGRLSRISTQLTYGSLPSATTSAATAIASSSAVLNGSGNPNGTTTSAWFRIATSSPGTCNDTFGTRVPLSGGTALGAGTSSVPYATTTKNLTQGTTYYYCAVASSTYGKGYGAVQSFTTASVPTVSTNAASSITATSALLNGAGNPNASSTTAWFRIATSSPGSCNDTFGTRVPLSGSTSLGAGTSSQPYSTTTSSLTANTTYYYCAIASNGSGKGYGTVQSFTTTDTSSAPSVTTSAASSITSSSAVLNGTGNPNGTTTTAWFRIDTSTPGTCNDTFGTRVPLSGGTNLGAGTSAQPYSTTTGSLAPSTTYYYCAVASNGNGTGVGTVQSFTTSAAALPPTVSTNSASSITQTSAILNGAGNPNGSSTTAWFRIDTSTPGTCNDTFGTRVPLSGSTSLGAGTSSIGYSTSTSGLSQNTTYFYCAIASNTNGTGYGGVQSFVTTSGTPTIITSNITTNTTWTSGVYVVNANIAVNTGVTLTINPNAIVKFNGTSLTVNGTLSAVGTANSPIYFTSYQDDSVGGDTNADATSTTGAGGQWGGIVTSAWATTTITHSSVRYGGGGFIRTIRNNGGLVTLTNVNVATTTNGGFSVPSLYHLSGTTTITNSTFVNDLTSVYIEGAPTAGAVTIASSTMKNSIYSGLSASAGSISFSNSVFTSNTYAAFLDFASGLQFTSSGNSGSGAVYLYSNISSDQTLEPGLPYLLTASITVNSGSTLTVKPGAIVKFDGVNGSGPSVGLVVDGTLNAQGGTSDTRRIHFTSHKDDTVGGDTNGDGASTSPAAGDWNGILIHDGASTTLRYGSLRYGGYQGSGGRSTQLYNDGGSIIVQNMEIATGTTYGIYHAFDFVGSPTLHVLGCDIHGHTYGVYVNDANNYPQIHSSNIHGNTTAGVYDNTFLSVVKAQYNYWGASNGPSGDGPGSGDAVHGADYSNWLPEVHFLNVDNGQIIRANSTGNIQWNWYNGVPTIFTTAWYGAIATWNALGATTIATSTGSIDLEVQDVSGSSADIFLGQYNPNYSPHRLIFNTYQMSQYATNTYQTMAATHELGHALGLEHSFLGNIMNSFVTASTTLGAQDIGDYDYLY